MASTPTNRLKLSASNTSLFQAFTRSPVRNRTYESRLSLKRVIGTTCTTPTAFDTAGRCFVYVAGGAVVVVDLDGSEYTQKFFRAHPTTSPVFQVAPFSQSSLSPGSNNITTPKANDARNRTARGSNGPMFVSPDYTDSQASKTWTSRERIKAATCVSLSRDGRFLAVGETGYAPRVLIFSVKDLSSDRPLVSISEHGFGVKAVAWSPDGKFLASLGTANDGCLFIWKIDSRTGSARLFQQSRCTSTVSGMLWLGNNLVTFGTRHVRAWKVVDEVQRPPSPMKKKVGTEMNPLTPQKTLPGRNVILGSLLDTTFTTGLALDESNALLCSEGGDVCLLDNTSGQLKLTQVTVMDYGITCCSRYGPVALIGGKDGQLARLDVEGLLDCAISVVIGNEPDKVILSAMGFVQDQLVTVDSDRSINVWKAGMLPGESDEGSSFITLPGQNDSVLGVQSLANTDESGLAFYTWSASGKILLWDLNGCIKESFGIAVEEVDTGNELDPLNQLCVVRADDNGKIFAAGDKVGVLRVVDFATRELLLETKAHTSEITHIAVHQTASRAYIATSGRDRTLQLFHHTTTGSFELLQTLEFPARVTHIILAPDGKIITSSMDRSIQIHELVSKEDEPNSVAAIHCRSIAMKATPNSVALGPDCKSLFVSTLDRSVYRFDLESGQALSGFKCTDENGSDTAVFDSLVFGPAQQDEPSFLLGLSNTDKSVRVYNASSGAFMDREWGHTESINGVALVDGGQETKKVVSVGCDGTIFIWILDLRDGLSEATSRSPSPTKDASVGPSRTPLRRILSKLEIAEFPRPSSSHSGRRSPPRTLHPNKSRKNLSSSSAASLKTPTAPNFDYPSSLAEETPTRQSSSNRSGSPTTTDTSPPSTRLLKRRPSMPALGSTQAPAQTARKKSSAINLRGSYGASAGSLQAASEQTCRQLRAYRTKLTASEATVAPEMLAELETELRLTGAAVAERVSRTQVPVTEPVLSGLLDRYSERLVEMLDEKLRLRLGARAEGEGGELGMEDGMALLRLAANGGDGEGSRPVTARGAAPRAGTKG